MKEAIPLLTEILNDNIASTEYRGTAAVNLGLITGEQQKYDRIYAKMMGWVK